MTYKWTLSYIDSITWPEIKGLLGAIREHPPTDLVIPAVFKAKQEELPTIKNIPAGLPVKKGKVGLIKKRK